MPSGVELRLPRRLYNLELHTALVGLGRGRGSIPFFLPREGRLEQEIASALLGELSLP